MACGDFIRLHSHPAGRQKATHQKARGSFVALRTDALAAFWNTDKPLAENHVFCS